MQKTYLLDTNILMRYGEEVIYGFEDNIVIIPSTVIEELDNLKDGLGDRGYQARVAGRALTNLRQRALASGEDITIGVSVNNGGLVRVETDNIDESVLLQGWSISKPDNQIISCAKNLGAILVTEDNMLAFKANMVGVEAQAYKNMQIKEVSDFTGRDKYSLTPSEMEKFLKGQDIVSDKVFTDNTYLHLESLRGDRQALGRYIARDNVLRPLTDEIQKMPIHPRNMGQFFALDALLAPPSEIPLVILQGAAGTAKTFLAVAGAMYGISTNKWESVLCTRNNVEFDKDIGALPGYEEEKVGPLLRGIYDNLNNYYSSEEYKTTKDGQAYSPKFQIETLEESELLTVQAMSFMRGRSIQNTYIIIDEAQNATISQMIGILTRAGEGSKIVLTGCIDQIDNPRLNKLNNGLAYASEKMKGSPLCAQIKFSDEECERSELAREATERMVN